MRVLSVVSELFPLVKTGGLADVAGALPPALAAEDVAMRPLLPLYPAVAAAIIGAAPAWDLPDLFGGPARVLAARAGSLDLFAIEAPHLYARDALYGHDDDAQRFAALGAVAAGIGRGAIAGFVPDVVHAHDWQGALAPAYLHYGGGRRPATVMTVHNLAYQGQFPAGLLAALGLPASSFAIEGVEYYGAIGFLKAGLRLADWITTVSPTYAAEIQTPAFGMGLDGLLRARAAVLSGIRNGIDTDVWNPANDAHLPARADTERPRNKAALQAALRLTADPDACLSGVISRLTWQKGMDILADALPALLAAGTQLALLGAGDTPIEAELARAAAAHPGRVGVRFGYDEGLAHLIQGGADALLVPSRFEPCGLTQLCALHYGAVPVVARVGGLADTVIDANEAALAAGVATGVQFAPVDAAALAAAVARTVALWHDAATWETIRANGMLAEVDWQRPAALYAALYRSLAV
ncbi:MAG TPA: glycogen synthase GlgA [Acetobacteraceae bacterium]|nr:glycogen synthase GlgA [Acetobacteraceae bacterium]